MTHTMPKFDRRDFLRASAAASVLGASAPIWMPNAFAQAKAWMSEHRVPVVVEIILERVTTVAMGTELDNVTEFEELAADIADAPTAVALLD